MDDNLMPNDGTYFLPREPEEQVIARKKDKAKILEALTVIQTVIAHFDERIAFRNSLEAIRIDQEESPELHLRACITNDMIKTALEEEKQLLLDELEVHAPYK